MAQGKSAKDQLGVELTDPINPQAVPVVEPPVEEVRPEWLPDKFKDEKEFAASYSSLENELRTRAENQKSLEQRLDQLTQVVEKFGEEPAKPQTQQTDQREALMAAYEADPISTIAYLADQAAEARLKAREEALKQENDPYMRQQQQTQTEMMAMYVDQALTERIKDWGDYKEKVGEALTADPTLIPQHLLSSPQATVEAISRVYEVVKAREIIAAAENGRQTGFVAEQMKERAQTLTGGAARQQQLDPVDEKMAALKAATEGMSYSAFRG